MNYTDKVRKKCAETLYLIIDEIKLMEEARIDDDHFRANMSKIAFDLCNELNSIADEGE